MSPDDDPVKIEHARMLNRLAACSFTLNSAFSEVSDPGDQELRVQLLLAIEDVLNTAHGLRNKASEYVWGELDSAQHPSNFHPDEA